MRDNSSPIELECTPASSDRGAKQSLRTFTSYSFDRNMMVPASPFRFNAEGTDRTKRLSVRSSDTAELFVRNKEGQAIQLATGFIDETDTNITPQKIGYLLSGRDTLGQMIDNSAIDSNNKIIHVAQISLPNMAEQLRSGTRIPGPIVNQNCPSGAFLFQTNPGETKINALQRYLEYANCLIWSNANGRMVVGKPNMTQDNAGFLQMSYSNPTLNNILECRVRRNTNTAIKQIAVQVQALAITDPAAVTIQNLDKDVSASGGGRSIYRLFSQGNGMDAVNQIQFVGNSAVPQEIGACLARREIALANTHVLEIEAVVKGHINSSGQPYNVDQIYSTFIEDEQVKEDLYLYAVRYDLTLERGMTTTLRLCRLGSLVADVPVRKQ